MFARPVVDGLEDLPVGPLTQAVLRQRVGELPDDTLTRVTPQREELPLVHASKPRPATGAVDARIEVGTVGRRSRPVGQDSAVQRGGAGGRNVPVVGLPEVDTPELVEMVIELPAVLHSDRPHQLGVPLGLGVDGFPVGQQGQ